MFHILRLTIFAVPLAALFSSSCRAADRPPNIVFLIADDLGYGDLGCYGQKKIRTPNIDRLASEGVKFTVHYAGHNVCAPSRCALMTGKHPGHGYIRENRQAKGFPEGQEPVPAGLLQLPLLFKKQGYTLGGFGKWGLGPVGSTGDPLKQGFDRWFGYNCQAAAHNYYPTHLWDNDKQIKLNNPKFPAYQKLPAGADPDDSKSYARYAGNDYAPDLIGAKALEFVRANKDRPFFLYFATTVPHLALQVPEDSLKEYAGTFPETPYKGDRGYLPHRQPRAAYAAMITRMDREVGRILALVKELNLDDNTIVVFTSDNGPLYDRLGGTDTDFFNSAAGFRGRKGSYYEGGFREPCLVRWKGRITAGSTTDRVTGFEDWLPTLLELVGAVKKTPSDIDGISFAPTLLGKKQPPRPFLYRESPGYGGQQCVRVGDWKAIRTNLNPGPKAKNQKPGEIELYNLATDPGEKTDVAAKNLAVVRQLRAIIEKEHVKSDLFPMRALDEAKPPQAALRASEPAPTHADVSYGPSPNQRIDIYLPPKDSGPFPVVLWFGGIWKPGRHPANLKYFWNANCAVIAVQTRTMTDAVNDKVSAPISYVLNDACRTVQFVRLNAGKWKLDPKRIAVGGGSQGALPALYVACAGERADPKSSDPVERVSTVVTCAAAYRSQPSIDPKRMQEWVPGVEWGAPALGCGFKESLKRRDELQPIIAKWSPDALLHRGTPPLYFENNWGLTRPDTVGEMDYKVHSPAWALGFQKLADKAGVVCYVKYPGHPTEKYRDIWDFIVRELTP